MNLVEWKNGLLESKRIEIKEQLHEGVDVVSDFFDDEEMELIKQEVEIEQFCEAVEFDGEYEIDNDLIEEDITEEHNPLEYTDFIPEEYGTEMDITLEFDLEEHNPSYVELTAIKEKFFAEDYEVLLDENKNRAQVVFRRSKGTITKRKKCKKGFRLVGNRCLPQRGGEKAKLRRKGIKLKRAKRAMGAGKKKRAALRAKITKRRTRSRNRSYSNTVN